MEVLIGAVSVFAFYSLFFVLFYLNTRKTINSLKNDVVKHIVKCTELEKKNKLSNDVLAILSDLKEGGAILHIERLDKNDVYFHQRGSYR